MPLKGGVICRVSRSVVGRASASGCEGNGLCPPGRIGAPGKERVDGPVVESAGGHLWGSITRSGLVRQAGWDHR
jgi:hypothetical protein